MSNEMTGKVLDGEILGPNDSSYIVTYWRHYNKQEYEADSIEDCIKFLHYGSESGDLSWADSIIKNISGDIVMTYEQVKERLDKIDEE